MKKTLLIATTALVATAGIASADITITGHAAAGIYSQLSNKDATAAVVAVAATGSAAEISDATAAVAVALRRVFHLANRVLTNQWNQWNLRFSPARSPGASYVSGSCGSSL